MPNKKDKNKENYVKILQYEVDELTTKIAALKKYKISDVKIQKLEEKKTNRNAKLTHWKNQ